MWNTPREFYKGTRLIIRLFASMWIVLIITWLVVWNTVEFNSYEWVWSEDNATLAWQYVSIGLWFLSCVVAPIGVWAAGAGCYHFILKKEMREQI